MPGHYRVGVAYPNVPETGARPYVERLNPRHINLKVASQIQQIMRAAYAAQFEGPDGLLPEGASKRQFNEWHPSKVVAQRRRMQQHVADYRSQYWLLRHDPRSPRIMGVAKVSPRFGGAYLNDISVYPDYQQQGGGSMLAHAAFKFGGYAQDAKLALDGYKGSSVNDWYESWGLEIDADQSDVVSIGGHNLHTRHYVSPADVSLGGIVNTLEERMPQLAAGDWLTIA